MGEIIRKKRELAYKGTVINVHRDYVEIDGKTAIWDYIEHMGAAAVIPVLDNGNIIMVRQYRNALDRYTLEIPAGKVDSRDEERKLCAFRELREESGYYLDSPDELEFLIRINTMVAFGDEEIDVFVARNLKKGEQDLDFDESIDVMECRLDDLVEKIYAGEIKDSKTVAAILAYQNKYIFSK